VGAPHLIDTKMNKPCPPECPSPHFTFFFLQLSSQLCVVAKNSAQEGFSFHRPLNPKPGPACHSPTTAAAGSVASTKSTRCQKASPCKIRGYHVFDKITKKPVVFNIATLNFPEGQKTQNCPPKKTKKEAIYFKKNQILASLEDGKIFWEESV